MMPQTSMAWSSPQHAAVRSHLFPGDGNEAAAILLCSRVLGTRLKLLVKAHILVPYALCDRHADFLQWPSEFVEQALDLAERDDLSIILLHCHPGGLFDFSKMDLESDRQIIPAIFAGRAKRHHGAVWHGSAVMVEDGAVRAQLYDELHRATSIDMVGVFGDDLRLFWNPDFLASASVDRPLAFSKSMSTELKHLSVCVVGTSGTGSIVAEQLGRLGFGEVILVDPDKVEFKNLNRILNSTSDDARTNRFKVDVVGDAIRSFRTDVSVKTVRTSIGTSDAITQSGMADFLFCCVDSHEGRQICDIMSSAFMQPLFDVGVTIPIRETGPTSYAILDVVGRIDYVWPGGSTLSDRGVISPDSVAAEYLAKTAPKVHEARVQEGYMPGAHEEAPSVITLNMRAASACVTEFVARAYPFRHDPNSRRARTLFSLAACEEEYVAEEAFAKKENATVGRGMALPLLGIPSLSPREL